MAAILGSVLSPIVSSAAPVSRPLASSANSSIQKYSADRIQLPIVLDFQSDKGKEEIRNWYNKQPTTRFTSVEHRKETTGRFRHEFIVVQLANSTVCRFDRRAREDMRGHALKDEGTVSEDSAHVITKVDTESKARLNESALLMTTTFDEANGLEFILALCCGIQSHPEAKSYSLLHYNCYFFSWTLLATIAHQSHRRSWGSDSTTQLVHAWVTALIDRLVAWEKLDTYRQKEPFWERLTHPGQIVIHEFEQKPVLFSNDSYIGGGMNRQLRDHFINQLVLDVNKVLFPSQISSWLKKEICSFLPGGYRNNSILSEKLEKPAHRIRRHYEAAIDTFVAYCNDFMTWSDLQWPRSRVDDRPHVQLIGFITTHMKDHFKQVESYGFGKAEPSIRRAEDTMTEIWVSVLDMMKNESELSFL